MYIHWESKINLSTSSIMLAGGKNYWDRTVSYRTISQTLSQCDLNPEGTSETRKLSRKILEVPGVMAVKLWRGTIFITVTDKTSEEEATKIVESVYEILQSLLIYGG